MRNQAADAPTPSEGKPVIVNVWASFCEPCKKELPLLQTINDERQLAVVGLSRDTRTGRAEEALKNAGVTYPNWMDSDASFAVALDGRIPLAQVPSSALMVDGKVIAVHIGDLKSKGEVLAALRLVPSSG